MKSKCWAGGAPRGRVAGPLLVVGGWWWLVGKSGHRGSWLCENFIVRTYAVVIHEEPEGGIWGEVPALPGCYSQGDTIDELKDNIREAIAGVLEVLKEQGREPDANIQILDVAV